MNTYSPAITEYPYSYEKSPDDNLISLIREALSETRFNLAARAIQAELQIQPNDKVLEIGGGIGILSEQIERISGAETKVYNAEICLGGARKSKDRGIHTILSDAHHLPFQSDTFNFAISTDVFEHLSDPKQVVTEMHRVLNPGGKCFIVIADPTEPRFTNVNDHIQRTQNPFTDIPFWEQVFQESGFEIDSQKSKKYRERDWRKIFNLPIISRLREKTGFACAFVPVYRPGVYILEKKTPVL